MSIDSLIPINIKQWVKKSIGNFKVLKKLYGGKNNQAFLLSTPKHKLVLKIYFADDNRCYQEVIFSKLLSSHNIPNTPELICADTNLHAACFAFVEGELPQDVDYQKVLLVADWLNKINADSVKQSAKKLNIPFARGALLTARDFTTELTTRLAQFQSYQPLDAVDALFDTFLQDMLAPAISNMVRRIDALPFLNEELPLCLSPSDIGFHNIIEGSTLICLDFEYAGWDSIDKLVNDFFAQPRYEMNIEWMPAFVQTAFPTADGEQLLERSQILLPATHLKWALIFLNDFTLSERSRRSFSDHNYNSLEVKKQQLGKARKRVLTALGMI